MSNPIAGTDRVRAIARTFLNQSGMSPVDLARRVGYSYNSLQKLLNGSYTVAPAGSAHICAAILDFIESHPTESGAPVNHPMYETQAVKTTREIFARLLKRPLAFLSYAPPGCGKTDIAKYLIAEHNAKPAHERDGHIFRIYCRKNIRPRDLFRRIAVACGTEANSAIERAIHNLRFDFKGKRVVLYFDEAQHLDLDAFETVRELLDEAPHFSLCFAGSDELEDTFDRFWRKGNAERLDRRITDKIYLPAVSADEAAGILRSELPGVFDDNDVRAQIKAATISARIDKRKQGYISIGRLMATIHEIREGLAAQEPDRKEAVSATD
jgi:DNA transposition AAA+ family ATPase